MNGGYNMEDERYFKIYAGLGGSFGGAECLGTYCFFNHEEAEQYAYEMAKDAYESYAGLHVPSYQDCLDEANGDEEEANYLYEDYLTSWLEYYAEEVEA